MSHTGTATQQPPCGTCNGAGTVKTEIYNTATGQTATNTETCLDCP
jgi:hypothetical protein